MIDVSFAGSCSIRVMNASGMSTDVTEFPADEQPYSVETVDVADMRHTANNEGVMNRKAVVYVLSVSVLPGGRNDEFLARMLEEASLDSGSQGPVADTWEDLTSVSIIETANGGVRGSGSTITVFTGGGMSGGPPAGGADQDGRRTSKTYNFTFASRRVERLADDDVSMPQ